MAHIKLAENAPGIIGAMLMYPDTAKHLNALANSLLSVETPTFSKKERELVASYVSFLNNCVFCSESHGAVADYFANEQGYASKIWNNKVDIEPRLQSILAIAAKVQKDARMLTQQDVTAAIEYGFSEKDIHDVVLISAAFCMFNRYVDGLGTFAPPRGDESYKMIGKMLAEKGYNQSLEQS
jgi:uncharacterized peroxidase-related enzyme